MWTSAQANTDIPFSAPWAEPHAQGESAIRGEWNWEYGIRRDMIAEGEAIRDRLFLAIYGAFSLAKKEASNSRLVLDNVPFLLGKRESHFSDFVWGKSAVLDNNTFCQKPDASIRCFAALDILVFWHTFNDSIYIKCAC